MATSNSEQSSTRNLRVAPWSRRDGASSPSSPGSSSCKNDSRPSSDNASPVVDRQDRVQGPSPRKYQQQPPTPLPAHQAAGPSADLPRPISRGVDSERNENADRTEGRKRGAFSRAVPAPLVLPFANRLTTVLGVSSVAPVAAPLHLTVGGANSINSSPSSMSSPSSAHVRTQSSPDTAMAASDAARSRDSRRSSASSEIDRQSPSEPLGQSSAAPRELDRRNTLGGGASADAIALPSRAFAQLREPERRFSPPSQGSHSLLPDAGHSPRSHLAPVGASDANSPARRSSDARRAPQAAELSPSSQEGHHLPAPPSALPSQPGAMRGAGAPAAAGSSGAAGGDSAAAEAGGVPGVRLGAASDEGASFAVRPSSSRLRGATAQPMMLPPPPLAMSAREGQAQARPLPPAVAPPAAEPQAGSATRSSRGQAVQLPQPPQAAMGSLSLSPNTAVLAASLSLGVAPLGQAAGSAARVAAGQSRALAEAAGASASNSNSNSSPPSLSPREAPQQRACPVRWNKGQELGRGSYGTVYEGLNEDDGSFFAVKEIALDGDPAVAQEIEHEVAMMRQLHHPNIVQYLGTCQRSGALYIFLELGKASLHSVLKKYQQFGESLIRTYTRQILHGLHYLHQQNVMHRDIKCANVLVFDRGQVKLADFGMAKSLTRSDMASSTKGSPYWMAPEVLGARNGGYGLAADIWSLGCTVLEMAEGRPPWSTVDGFGFIFRLKNGEVPSIPEHLSAEARDFLRLCLQHDPARRPTAGELLAHAFVATGEGASAPANVGPSVPLAYGAGAEEGAVQGVMPRRSGPAFDASQQAHTQSYVQAQQRQMHLQPGTRGSASQLSPPSPPVASGVFHLPTVAEGAGAEGQSVRGLDSIKEGMVQGIPRQGPAHAGGGEVSIGGSVAAPAFPRGSAQLPMALQRPSNSPPFHPRLPSPVSSEFPSRAPAVNVAAQHPSQPYIPLVGQAGGAPPPPLPVGGAYPRSTSLYDSGRKNSGPQAQIRRHTEPAEVGVAGEGWSPDGMAAATVGMRESYRQQGSRVSRGSDTADAKPVQVLRGGGFTGPAGEVGGGAGTFAAGDPGRGGGTVGVGGAGDSSNSSILSPYPPVTVRTTK